MVPWTGSAMNTPRSRRGASRVKTGVLQWVRIEGCSPGTHELPSRAVEALWSSLRSDEGDWEAFRDSPAIDLDAGLDALTRWVPDGDSEAMRATWSDALDDEMPLTRYPTFVNPRCGVRDRRIVRPSTGNSDFSDRDFCADLRQFTTP